MSPKSDHSTYRVVIPLESNPKIAECVGYIMGHFSLAESILVQIFIALTGLSQQHAQLIFFEISSRRRREILKLLSSEVSDGELKTRLVSSMGKDVKLIYKMRNRYAHHLYAANENKSRLTLINPIPENSRFRQLTLKEIQHDLCNIKKINYSLQDIFIKLNLHLEQRK